MSNATKLKKLMFARERLLSELKHSIASANTLSRVSKPLLIVCKDRTLEKYWAEFESNLKAIIEMSETTDDNEAFFAANQAIEDEYHLAKVHLDEILPNSDDPNLSILLSSFHGDQTPKSNDKPERHSRSHLPDIKLKSFDGNYNEWQQFSALFEKMVAKEKLDSVDKMYYLIQSLKGEPSHLVKHLPLTEDSFERAWTLLKENYDIRRHMVNSQFELFFGLKKLQKENANELRNMLRICLECESAFKALDLDAATLGLMMVYYCSIQMDSETARQWAFEQKGNTKEAKLSEFIEFLQTRCRLLSQYEKTAQATQPSVSQKPETKPPKHTKSFLAQSDQSKQLSCLMCSGTHRVFSCPMLLNATLDDRRKMVIDKRLCFNCLYNNHRAENCQSKYNCAICKKRHNTLLHPVSDVTEQVTSSLANFSGHAREGRETLLATACIPVYHSNGDRTIIRALIDQGSTASFVSERVCQLIGANRHQVDTIITSINNSQTGTIKSFVNLTIGSMYDKKYQLTFDALVLPKITSVQATSRHNVNEWQHIRGLQLADPKFLEPGDIDVLLGARVYAEILLPGLMKGRASAPIAQLTKVGWILSGACEANSTKSKVSCHLATCEENTLSKCLQRLWQIEEVENKVVISNEDALCEKSYADGVSRARDGKLVMRLPFKIDPCSEEFLGDSYNKAYVRLLQLERRLIKDEKLYDMYRQVLDEYVTLGHMREATPEEIADPNGYFLPHHAVVKMNKSTSKVRVVFDASCASSNGKSLNNVLMVGPTIQDDLFSLVLRWRKYAIAYTGDIEKMYRQFWVHKDHVKFQRILWRRDPSQPIKQNILLTVTFGTASAPFQAIRSLHEVANQVEHSSPEIARAIKKNFYVDDFLGSSDTVKEAQAERQAITNTLKEYGLNITKWKSNSPEFQKGIPDSQQENILELADASCKALGICWQPKPDVFTFKLSLDEVKFPLTKRKIVSEVAKLFDPLGWLAPSIVLAKLVIQQLWIEALDWDDKVSQEIEAYWLKLRKLLFECDQIKIDRWVGLTCSSTSHTIHGFSDASERAYAAVVYLRTIQPNGAIRINILAAKSKVAPLQKITLPRLELCGALLLAKLIKKIVNAMELVDVPIYAYSDSTIVLSWLRDRPIRWTTFVANRVSEIQELIPSTNWRHVVSQLNPADCASRGKFIDELRTFDLWWHGPEFLKQSEDQWPTREFTKLSVDKLPEQRKSVKLFHAQVEENSLLHRFSTLTKLLKITAYILRWKNYKRSANPPAKANALLSVHELERALFKWLRVTQRDCFPEEVHRLQRGKEVHGTSVLKSYAPSKAWHSNEQVIRVGGRLHHANLAKDMKHPIVLPSKHRFTWLVINDAHLRTMHGGCQLTLQYIRQRFWVVHGRTTVTSQINKCVRCCRYKMQMQKQLMGDLPEYRTKVTHPFQYVGVDFAGYFEVKQSTRRNAPYEKCYVALFVCMVTKAIHLEVAKDLSTEAFLDAYRCFTARRGIPDRLYSDRGTNFIGAYSEMPNLLYDAQQQQAQLIVNELLADRTEWHFIPAHAPHFGGLWEAGVKAMKFHLRRVLHQAKLTEHQFRTVITQIEACLNSRPLCPLTEDADDVEVLTPGHFLIGRALKTLPEPDYTEVPENRLKLYQRLQRLTQDFWKQWHLEYLQTLQKRSKWTQTHNNVAVGQLVLLRDENLPPSRWLLARITKVSAGADQLVRAVEVQCKNAVLTRSIHKLCLLPTEDNSKLLFEQMQLLKAGEHVEADTNK